MMQRHFLMILLLAWSLDCANSALGASTLSTKCDPQILVAGLDHARFFDFLDKEHAIALREAIARDGAAGIFLDGMPLRLLADWEDISEGGAEKFISDLKPALSSFGIVVPEMSTSYDDTAHILHVGGNDYKLYDFQNETAKNPQADPWSITFTRTIALVNTWLAGSGVSVRLFAINGGNDGYVYFMTPEAAAVLQDCDELGYERPYLPTEDPPYYGLDPDWWPKQ